jgi:hypothetical protein
MPCERSCDPLSRMLLKGDEGGAKFGGGWPKMAIFARGDHYPWMILALRVTATVPLPLSDLSTQKALRSRSLDTADCVFPQVVIGLMSPPTNTGHVSRPDTPYKRADATGSPREMPEIRGQISSLDTSLATHRRIDAQYMRRYGPCSCRCVRVPCHLASSRPASPQQLQAPPRATSGCMKSSTTASGHRAEGGQARAALQPPKAVPSGSGRRSRFHLPGSS